MKEKLKYILIAILSIAISIITTYYMLEAYTDYKAVQATAQDMAQGTAQDEDFRMERLSCILDNYLVHAANFELDLKRFLKIDTINFISHSELYSLYPANAHAITEKYDKEKYSIYLNEDLLERDPRFMEAIIYHELWHVYSKEKHCTGDEYECHYILRAWASEKESWRWGIQAKIKYFNHLKDLDE